MKECLSEKPEFKEMPWYKNIHTVRERHHLTFKVPNDVNLIDVIEYMSDCIAAGLAQDGQGLESK